MFADIPIFKVSHAMAVHAGTRQTIIAENIANADTPGYRARDIRPFAEMLAQGNGGTLRASRPGHLDGATLTPAALRPEDRRASGGNPNGNTVTLETEMLNAVEVKRQHDRALAIYKSAMTILRAGLGRR